MSIAAVKIWLPNDLGHLTISADKFNSIRKLIRVFTTTCVERNLFSKAQLRGISLVTCEGAFELEKDVSSKALPEILRARGIPFGKILELNIAGLKVDKLGQEAEKRDYSKELFGDRADGGQSAASARAARRARRARMGASGGGGGGGVHDDAPLTRDEQVLMTMEDNSESLTRTLASLHQTEQVSKATMHQLDEQGEQLRNVKETLNATDNALDKTERSLRGIRSVGGAISNFFRGKKKEKDPAANLGRTWEDDNRPAATASAAPSGGRSARPAARGSVKELEDGALGDVNGGDRSQGQLHDRVKAHIEREDAQLDQVSTYLDRLGSQAKDINHTLDRQNRQLDDIDDHVDRVDARITKQAKDTRRAIQEA